jgi:hypothetical protein
MSKTYVHWTVRRIDPKDTLHGLLLEKEVSFPTFMGAANFARAIRTPLNEEIVGKPLLEEVA